MHQVPINAEHAKIYRRVIQPQGGFVCESIVSRLRCQLLTTLMGAAACGVVSADVFVTEPGMR